MTVWVLLIIVYSGGGNYRSGWATSQQIGPYPTKAACESVRDQLELPDGAWWTKSCVARMKTKADAP